MVFNATFNNISVILWQSVLLMEETGVPRENHGPVTSHWQTLSHNVVSSTPPHMNGVWTTLVVIGTDYTGSCKSNYHTITIMMVSNNYDSSFHDCYGISWPVHPIKSRGWQRNLS
jgi:hypothetical protein